MLDINWLSLQLRYQQSKIKENFCLPVTDDQDNMLVEVSIRHLSWSLEAEHSLTYITR